jgi:hypothetical protein
VLCLFTAALTLSTIALWRATRAAAQRQFRDTEILQRAYVSRRALQQPRSVIRWRMLTSRMSGTCLHLTSDGFCN